MSQQFNSQKSLVKLIVYLRDRTSKTYYSLENEDKKGTDYVQHKMHFRLLAKRHKNQFTTAIFYDNVSGNELAKYDFFGNKVNR